MGVLINIEKAISDYKQKGGKTSFEDSLRQVLQFAQADNNLNEVSDLAYLLATAKAESDYSLQRWESDYICGLTGKPYNQKPCEKALNYYRSTKEGKKNYYTLGTDQNGLPYFGRGLIQLTGKANYEKYGKLIGVDLINNGDLALKPKNSYQIATTFLSQKRGGIYAKNGANRSTFDMAKDGDLTKARKSVNGGSKGLQEVNKYYELWKEVLQNNLGKSNNFVLKSNLITDKKKRTKQIIAIGLALLILGVSGTLTYLYLKKRGNLPNFMKKINI